MRLTCFAMGAIGGLFLSAAKLFRSGRNDEIGSAPQRRADSGAAATTSSSTDGDPLAPEGRTHSTRFVSMAVGGGVVSLLAGSGLAFFLHSRRKRIRRRASSRAEVGVGRIPLTDVIRFKERQWFVEELENSRDGDCNAMLRLAKMYLHGQGCQRNIAMAQEWLRKARQFGVAATLDELFATDDPEPHAKLRRLMVQEERRRAMRRASMQAQLPLAPRPAA